MTDKTYNLFAERVFTPGQEVIATCNYMHQITEGKKYVVAGYIGPRQTPTFRFPAYVEVIGDSGTLVLGHTHRFRPVHDAAGKFVACAKVSDVRLNTAYRSWGRARSREISDLTEEQRTGPLRGATPAGRVTIKHSIDVRAAPQPWYYDPGDYRDNGDGTGTVLTLEEIFLNGLKK